MLSGNIKAARKSKGLSQEDLAVKLNVVRQTVSKWEQGLSVPDSDMLVSLSEALETPVGALLGGAITQPEADSLTAISERLEVINAQLARRKAARRRTLHWLLILTCAAAAAILAALVQCGSPYQGWDYSDPETAVFGAALHVFEWGFIRVGPVILLAGAVGIFLTRKKA